MTIPDHETQGNGGAEGVADQNRLRNSKSLQDLFHPLHIGGYILLSGPIGLSVAGQVERDDIEEILQGCVLPNPIRMAAAGAVDKDQRLPIGEEASIAPPANQFSPIDFLDMDHEETLPDGFMAMTITTGSVCATKE